jgi:catechol 2,3-dioxygenase-like lactoylglutathione lyase family enzyme
MKMSARIRHVAIVSEQYALEGRFYEAVFGMKSAPDTRPERAVTVSDGYVGLNINPRRSGRTAGLVQVLARPSTRPFAGISTHDPDGNVFDLSQKSMGNRASVYVEAEREQARTISHIAIRTLNPEATAAFYADVFGLEPPARKAGDPNYTVGDGRVALVLMPWSILDYHGGGIARPGPDHIGFRVDSLAALQEHVARVGDNNPHLRPLPVGAGPEGEARLKLFASSCPHGHWHLADPDGVLIDVAER